MVPRPARAAFLPCLLLLAACGGDDAPLEVPGPEVRGGNAGVDAPVSEEVTVQDVELAFPEDGVYREGEDAALYVGITNTGTEPVTLVGVAGPDFSGVEVIPGLPLEVPGDDNLYIGAEGAPTITLVDLGEQLRSSESIPVTFTFEQAGAVTVEAVVDAAGQDPEADVDFPDPDPDPTDG
jgi:copper(I)-binding protein